MIIRRLVMMKFMAHDRTVIDFPQNGFLLITGDNGEGKSGIIEGVSWGGWGKTLRGDVPWRGDASGAETCSAQLMTEDVSIARTRAGSKNEVDWEYKDPNVGEYPTARKSQEALSKIVGPYELWRRTHVFSSADAAHFSLATDATRKQLIETFLGNDRFDPALKACRADLKAASSKLSSLERDRDVKAAKLEAAQARLSETKRAIAAIKSPEGFVPEVSSGKTLLEYDAKIAAAEREISAIRAQLRKSDTAGAEHEAAAKHAEQLLARLRADTCPTCSQAIPKKLRDGLQKKASAAKDAAKQARDRASEAVADLESTLEDISDEVEVLRTHRSKRAAEVAASQAVQEEQSRYEVQRALLQKTMREADDDIAQLTPALEELAAQFTATTTDVAELTQVDHILGFKGVRAHILGRSLAGIEAVANSWMSRLDPEVCIELSPYSEKGVQDSISLTINGLGRGTYKSTSAGERRRVDLSLLLGLAEVASAAQGRTPGTMFFDEVFDCLDAAGTEAVVQALEDMAKTRCIVVITHSKLLVERLPNARHLHVANGVVSELG